MPAPCHIAGIFRPLPESRHSKLKRGPSFCVAVLMLAWAIRPSSRSGRGIGGATIRPSSRSGRGIGGATATRSTTGGYTTRTVTGGAHTTVTINVFREPAFHFVLLSLMYVHDRLLRNRVNVLWHNFGYMSYRYS